MADTIQVKRIQFVPNGRPLLFGDDPHYAVIADIPRADFNVREGDVVAYEPGGKNFGWAILKREKRP